MIFYKRLEMLHKNYTEAETVEAQEYWNKAIIEELNK